MEAAAGQRIISAREGLLDAVEALVSLARQVPQIAQYPRDI